LRKPSRFFHPKKNILPPHSHPLSLPANVPSPETDVAHASCSAAYSVVPSNCCSAVPLPPLSSPANQNATREIKRKRNPLFVQSTRLGCRRRVLVHYPLRSHLPRQGGCSSDVCLFGWCSDVIPFASFLLGGACRRWRIPASVRDRHLQLRPQDLQQMLRRGSVG
jgi:hypothetical protein